MSTPSRRMSGRHLGDLRSAAMLLLLMALAPLGCSKNPSTLAPTSPNLDPLATAKVSPDSGAAPLAVRFEGAVSDVDGSIVSYQWDFGDGTTSDALVADHDYEGAGTYTAKLVATDDRRATALAMVTVRVKGNKAPTATIGASPMSGPAPLTVSFTGTGTDVSLAGMLAMLDVLSEILDAGRKDGTFRHDLNVKTARRAIFGALDEISLAHVLSRKRKYEPAKAAAEIYRIFADGLCAAGRDEGGNAT